MVQARTLLIPEDATNILLQAFVDIFINNFSTFLIRQLDEPEVLCYKVGGTTYWPNYSLVESCVF